MINVHLSYAETIYYSKKYPSLFAGTEHIVAWKRGIFRKYEDKNVKRWRWGRHKRSGLSPQREGPMDIEHSIWSEGGIDHSDSLCHL